MHVKKFRAATMQEALQLVKAEFGSDAVVLATRAARGSPLGLGLFGKPQVEVTAAIDRQPGGSTTAAAPLDRPAETLAQEISDTLRLHHQETGPDKVLKLPKLLKLAGLPKLSGRFGARHRDVAEDRSTAPAPQREPRRALSNDLPDAQPEVRHASAPSSDWQKDGDLPELVQHEMYSLTDLIRELSDTRRKGKRAQLSTQLLARLEKVGDLIAEQGVLNDAGVAGVRPGYTTTRGPGQAARQTAALVHPFTSLLTEQGIDANLARRLIARLERAGEQGAWKRETYGKAYLAQELMGMLQVSGPIKAQPGQQRVVALAGPTGVGKTTTIAKLAAEYHLQQRRRVSLITVDIFRVAAVEQLHAYAEIMGLEVAVVSNAREFRSALQAAATSDLVLIDTAGRSPRDSEQLDALSACFAVAPAIEVHLVLSCTTKDINNHKTMRKFNRLHYTHLLLTKLDEAEVFGSLVNLPIASGKPVSYLTTGQRVPEDIEVATKERLVDLIVNLSGALAAA